MPIVLLLLLGTAATVAYAVTRRKPIPKGSPILVMGDSLAVGLAPQIKKIAEAAGYRSMGEAVGGTRFDQWAPGFQNLAGSAKGLDVLDAVRHYRPALVLISLGTNSAGPAYNEQRDTMAATAIRQAVEREGARLVWIGMPKLPYNRLPNQDKVRAIVKGVGPDMIDSRTFDLPPQGDGIHFGADGYTKWAQNIWGWLLNSGDVK